MPILPLNYKRYIHIFFSQNICLVWKLRRVKIFMTFSFSAVKCIGFVAAASNTAQKLKPICTHLTPSPPSSGIRERKEEEKQNKYWNFQKAGALLLITQPLTTTIIQDHFYSNTVSIPMNLIHTKSCAFVPFSSSFGLYFRQVLFFSWKQNNRCSATSAEKGWKWFLQQIKIFG